MNGAEDTQCEKYFTPPEKHIFKEEIINKAHQIIEKNLVADGDKHFLSFDGLDELFSCLDDALQERLDREKIAETLYGEHRGTWDIAEEATRARFLLQADQVIKRILEE